MSEESFHHFVESRPQRIEVFLKTKSDPVLVTGEWITHNKLKFHGERQTEQIL